MTMETQFVNSNDYLDAKNGKNDCAVKAFAICMDCSYAEAENYMTKYLDRVNTNKGTNAIKLIKHLNANAKMLYDIKDKENNYPVFKSQLMQKVKQNPTFSQFKKNVMDFNKTYYILVNGHALAVKNGVIYGNRQDAKISRKRLWAVYEF